MSFSLSLSHLARVSICTLGLSLLTLGQNFHLRRFFIFNLHSVTWLFCQCLHDLRHSFNNTLLSLSTFLVYNLWWQHKSFRPINRPLLLFAIQVMHSCSQNILGFLDAWEMRVIQMLRRLKVKYQRIKSNLLTYISIGPNCTKLCPLSPLFTRPKYCDFVWERKMFSHSNSICIFKFTKKDKYFLKWRLKFSRAIKSIKRCSNLQSQVNINQFNLTGTANRLKMNCGLRRVAQGWFGGEELNNESA